jgi:hypothetical protein
MRIVTCKYTHINNHIKLCNLYEHETSFLTTEEHRLRMLKNKVLRGIFGPKRDEVTGRWRKLHNEKLHKSHYSQNIITVIKSRCVRQTGHVHAQKR